MGRPVVAAEACVNAMRVVPEQDLLPAHEADDFLRQVLALLADAPRAAAIGAAGRRCVLSAYSWAAHLQTLDRHLQRVLPGLSLAAPPGPAMAALTARARA